MACSKHGYTNNAYCPACDLESIDKYTKDLKFTKDQEVNTPKGKGIIQNGYRIKDKAIYGVFLNDTYETEDFSESEITI